MIIQTKLTNKYLSRLALTACIALGVTVAHTATADSEPEQESTKTQALAKDILLAHKATIELQQQLGAKLKSAMSKGGIQQGIEVCSVEAQKISAELSTRYQKTVGRTALRTRNPDNAPTEAQKVVLETLERDLQNHKDPKKLEHFSTLDDGTKLYMRPIVTQPQCLACHGDISDSRRAEIQKFYPHDQATGFKVGELRGAFVVTWE